MSRYTDIIKQHCYTKKGNFNGRCNSIDWWEKRDLLYVYNDIISYTEFLSAVSVYQRVYHYINEITAIPKCENCDNQVNWQVAYNRYGTYCSNKCTAIATTEQRKNTSIQKYGVDNPAKATQVKDKIKKTTQSNHGVSNYALTDQFSEQMKNYHAELSEEVKDQIRDKRKQTCIERYNAESPLQSDEILAKCKQSMLDLYGVEHALQSEEIKQSFLDTMNERYGKSYYTQLHLDDEFIKNIRDIDWFTEQLKTKSLQQIASENNMTYARVCQLANQLQLDIRTYSSFETEVYQYISERYNGTILRNYILPSKKQLDIYLPELNLAIECNGLYWHSELSGRKDRNYHLDKLNESNQLGIRLLHIFENEWYLKQEICCGQLNKHIKYNQSVFYGRQTKIIQIVPETEKWFLNENHLQGYTASLICYGLYYNDELVQIMSFGHSRYNKKYDYEIIRICTKLNHYVVGGIEKLFAAFVEYHSPESIITYSDRRWFDGDGYKRLGFELLHYSAPGYHYIHSNNRYILENRSNYQKHKLSSKLKVFDESLSEWENMQNNGYDRIWDCGNSVWCYCSKTINTTNDREQLC